MWSLLGVSILNTLVVSDFVCGCCCGFTIGDDSHDDEDEGDDDMEDVGDKISGDNFCSLTCVDLKRGVMFF